MSVQIAPADHDDAKRLVDILEGGLAPWPAYSWVPRWPAPWELVVPEEVADELLRRLYDGQPGQAALVQGVAQAVEAGASLATGGPVGVPTSVGEDPVPYVVPSQGQAVEVMPQAPVAAGAEAAADPAAQAPQAAPPPVAKRAAKKSVPKSA